jgi:hypothetical protein
MITIAKLAITAGLGLAVLVPAAASAASASAATQGVGVALLNTGPGGTPDTFIGTIQGGSRPDPIPAGTSRTYQVRITNPATSSAPEAMAVFASAATMSTAKLFTWSAPSPAAVNPAASWTAVAAPAATVAPGASYTTDVTVTVPAGTAPGTYYAMVWAGPVASGAGTTVKLAVYSGIREYITVPAK